METNASASIARDLMAGFAGRTGLAPAGRAPRRYLWTDAFAVCNFLELFRRTQDEEYRALALRLVDQVHAILGRHRGDDSRNGWISGLGEEEGRRHPTLGGLRIGKEMNERHPGEPFDESLEWDRDGQYYHYLTKWMHALNCLSRVTKDPVFNSWAVELAKTAHARFTHISPFGDKRLYWKMSIDLSRPLVPSMGLHDPLDGLVTCSELQATAVRDFAQSPPPDLRAEITDLAEICRGKSWDTDEPLGIGGLLFDAWRMAQLTVMGAFGETGLLEAVLEAARLGLDSLTRSDSLRLPADYRLAFRELGLSIGLQALERMRGLIGEYPGMFSQPIQRRVEALRRHAPLSEAIERFWVEGENRETGSWREHREINMVMLATSLAPEGFLTI